jgi:hypothetical protein
MIMDTQEVIITSGGFHDINNVVGKAKIQRDLMTPMHVLYPVFAKKDTGLDLIGFDIGPNENYKGEPC